jgi:adenine deaminase
MQQLTGNIVDIHRKEIYPCIISIDGSRILKITRTNETYNNYIIPGLVDAHVHIESSMLTPYEFSKAAIKQGTVATVSDPHEIANVLGEKGIRFMIENGEMAQLKFHWGIPSCVPATTFETSGAGINSNQISELFSLPNVVCLAEMMNFPGVIYDDVEVLKKLSVAKKFGLPIDGHAPGLTGDNLVKYIDAGVSTDHECTTLEEAIEKIKKGMVIQIRNGSSAKNFNELASLIDMFPDKVMLCCDDLHPEDLIEGHINAILKLGIEKGVDLFNLLRAATYNPIKHYNLKVGLLKEGDYADFCMVDNLTDFSVLETWINGIKVFSKHDFISLPAISVSPLNNFQEYSITENDLKIRNENKDFKAIGVLDGELLTKSVIIKNLSSSSFLESDIERDVLKIAVINRYFKTKPALGFIHHFGLKRGAVASSVAHDSHNIIVVGTNDADMLSAISILMKSKGGIVVVEGDSSWHLPLPIAGLLSTMDAEYVAWQYLEINQKVKECGSRLHAPLMTLAFMALLVIPELKLSDKGLFDGTKFEFTSLFV